MTEQNIDTAAKILKAAEDEFLEKGYGNARMLSIAARAGVSHSMLHYYYRSKEELFQKVFDGKVELVSRILDGIYREDESLVTIIRKFVENQFDTIRENSGFPMFVIRDVVSVRENLEKAMAIAEKRFSGYLEKFTARLDGEIRAGRIRKISPLNLLLDIVSMNITTFLALPAIEKLLNGADIDKFLEERKKSNADFIIAALRP